MKKMFKVVSFVLMLCLAVGCAGMKDSTRTKTEGAVVGTAAGAATGALVGQLIGRDTKSTLIGAAIGAGVGAAAGYVVGDIIAQRKANYASEEDRLDDEINIASKYNEDLDKFNNKIAKRNSELKAQIADLKKVKNVDQEALKNKKAELNSLIGESNKKKEQMSKELSMAEEYKKSLPKTINQDKSAQLVQEINRLKKGISVLDATSKQMAKTNSSIVSK